MFRFLLEGYDNLAYFTVLNRHEALLKIVFSPHRERAARAALEAVRGSVPLVVEEWPFSEPAGKQCCNDLQDPLPSRRPPR